MKKIYQKVSIVCACILAQVSVSAQCGVQQNGGSSTNMFTLIRNNTSSIAYDKALNTVVFIHRNDATAFGGNSGILRYDISTDGGTTWALNQGTLNPVSTNYARYPNIAIYNPAANTNTANAYVSYLAPTIQTLTSAWNGEVSGVSQLGSTSSTETYNQNGIGTTWQAGSLVSSAPGIFWAIDPTVPAGLTGFNIYKGMWNSTTSDIVWNINFACIPPFNTTWSSPTISDYNIAFDPTGQIGYFSFLGHVTPGPSQYGLYPVLYKTINGGTSWTGPIQVDLTAFSCITSNTVSPNVPSANIEHDLVVDVNGNPHLITTLGGASYYNFSYSTWHHMYDITLTDDLWAAYDLGVVYGGPGTLGTGADIATQWQAPQAARTNDGTKVFFTWTDNSSYSNGAPNLSPNLYGKAYNVTTDMWTQTKDFTSCSLTLDGNILYPHIAPEVIEPNSTTYKLAAVYGENVVPGNVAQTANFKFLDNITFTSSDFSIATTPATVTIQQAPPIIVCPNTSLTINVTGAGQAIWSTGVMSPSLSITSGTATSYSVVAQVGCNVGTASVAVMNLTVNTISPAAGVCPGSPAGFSVTGNALGYTWTPGNVTGTNVTLNPTANTVTLTTMGSASCISTQTVSLNLLSPPTLNIAGNNTICAGTVLSQTVTGAQTYLWSDGSTNSTFTDTPLTNTSYTVTGTAANTCTNTQTVSVVVKPSPTVTAVSNPTAVCDGQDAVLTSLGATTYSWNGVSSAGNMTITPTASGIYTATGAGTNLCETSQTVEVVVYALPSITITPAKALFCKGEKIKLTASGASSYTWTSPGSLTSSVQVNPTVTTVYSVNASSAEGCANSKTFTLTVSPCTGIDEQSNTLHLQIYPNPTTGKFVVKGEGAVELKIINELGQVVKLLSLNESNAHEVSVEDLSGGIYFVVGQQGSLQVKQKLIVTR